jgi:steroid 5-alpha reductase family enzyme
VAGADYQLAAFRADARNQNKVLSSVFFYYTRHPNYFGDFCVWCGFWLLACADGGGGATTVGSIVLMFVLLRYVSGAALLDRCQSEVKPKYRDYIRRHSAFFPFPPSAQ